MFVLVPSLSNSQFNVSLTNCEINAWCGKKQLYEDRNMLVAVLLLSYSRMTISVSGVPQWAGDVVR